MFGFLIKKNFCDGWDNVFNLVVVNLVFLLSGVLFAGFIMVFFQWPLIWVPVFLLMTTLFGVFGVAYGTVAANIADFKGVHIADFFSCNSKVS